MTARNYAHRRERIVIHAGHDIGGRFPDRGQLSGKRARVSGTGETRKSKSRRKRESLALQALGESLAALAASELSRIPMWPDLEAAVADARDLERSARRRQIRYIARLLRERDVEPIVQALEAARRPGRREAARHRRIERIRDALMRDDKVLDDLRELNPDLDVRQLRRLVGAARRERTAGSTTERRLFRFLRDCGLDA